MSEIETEKEFNLRDFLGALSRRRKAAIVTAVSCLVTTLSLALFLPPHFRSTGTILIEQQEVPVDLVRSTVTSYADERVQMISQKVMVTQKLLDIIRRYDLYPSERLRDTREELMERMRKDIDFKMISADVVDPRSGMPRQATIAFTVSYTSRSPDQAVKVANELTSLYLQENLTERARLANDASRFLLDEGDRLSKQIADLEDKLAQFKSKHMDSLPELQTLNMQLLDRNEQELRDTEAKKMSLDQQRVFLEAQLAQIKPHSMLTTDSGERIMSPTDRLKMLKSQLASARALYSPDHPDIARLEREIHGLEADTGVLPDSNELQRQLENARGELAAAREKYSADHPDVERLTRRIAGLEADLKKERSAASASSPRSADLPDNPAYIQLQAQLSSTLNDQSALDGQLLKLRAQIANYQRNVATSPQIEREYRELSRDYDNAQLKYREVRSKQMEAQLAQNLESDRKGEHFTLIEPPLPPEQPVSPNRPAILIVGLILTLVLSVGMAALRETLDATVRGKRDMQDVFAGPPLTLVPRIVTAGDLLLRRHRTRLALGATAAVAVIAVIAVHFMFRPLDVLWFQALRRISP